MTPSARIKLALRRELRDWRRSLSPHQQRLASRRLTARLLLDQSIRGFRRIAVYWPCDGEISPLPAARAWQQRGYSIFLPAIGPNHTLEFRRWCPGQTLQCNQYGIPEPRHNANTCGIADLDLMILPLVGFDRRGFRLGMGGGYYDRALANRGARSPYLVGVAHSGQRVQCLPLEPWDQPVNRVITDKNTTAARW